MHFSFNLFFSLFVFYVCVCTHVCASTHMSGVCVCDLSLKKKSDVDFSFFYFLSPYFLARILLIKTAFCCFHYTGWLARSHDDFPVFLPELGSQVCSISLSLYMGPREPSLDPLTCASVYLWAVSQTP